MAIADKPVKITTSHHPETKLKSWLINHDGFFLELSQRLPDQNRAFFMSRGFSSQVSNQIALECIFKTVIQSRIGKQQDKHITLDLADWRVIHKGKSLSLKTRKYWKEVFLKKYPQPKSRELILIWALYPNNNRLAPGDYNWGMTSYGLKPGKKFNLQLKWKINNKPYQTTINDMQCAPDKDRL